MESIARLNSIPIIESGVKTAENVYANLKVNNKQIIYIALSINCTKTTHQKFGFFIF